MTANPISLLFQSRKFWLLLLDIIGSLVLYFVGKYGGSAFEDVKYVILAIQPMFLLIIYLYTKESVEQSRASAEVTSAKLYNLPETKGVTMDATISAVTKPRTFLFVMYETATKPPTIKEVAGVITMSPPPGERWFWISVPVGITPTPQLPTITELH